MTERDSNTIFILIYKKLIVLLVQIINKFINKLYEYSTNNETGSTDATTAVHDRSFEPQWCVKTVSQTPNTR